MFEGESVCVEVKGRPEDRQALSAAFRNRRALHSRIPLIVAAVVFALSVVFGRDALFNTTNLSYPMAATLAAIAGLFLFLAVLNIFARARRMEGDDPRNAFFRGFKVTVGPQGVDIESEFFQGRFRWPAILRLHETAAHLFLYTDGLQAIIVPKRSFASPEEASRFAIIVRAHTGTG